MTPESLACIQPPSLGGSEALKYWCPTFTSLPSPLQPQDPRAGRRALRSQPPSDPPAGWESFPGLHQQLAQHKALQHPSTARKEPLLACRTTRSSVSLSPPAPCPRMWGSRTGRLAALGMSAHTPGRGYRLPATLSSVPALTPALPLPPISPVHVLNPTQGLLCSRGGWCLPCTWKPSPSSHAHFTDDKAEDGGCHPGHLPGIQ